MMSPDFFTSLEAELSSLTRSGTHLDAVAHGRHRLVMLIRRAAVIVTLATALAASLDSEFPASASGHAPPAPVLEVPGA